MNTKSRVARYILNVLSWGINNSKEGRESLFRLFLDNLSVTSYCHGPSERLIIGERVSRANTLFNTRSGTITVKTGVMFGHNCMVLTGYHDISKPGETRKRVTLENAERNIVIEEGVWIASGTIILGPCKIGKNSVIGSGAVVVSDIPEQVLAVGNPARVVKKIEISE